MKIIKFVFLLLFILIGKHLPAQNNSSQIIKGIVRDNDSHTPLIGAIIVIEKSNPIISTSTDNNGYFILTGVPVGRHTLRITYIGYESYIVRELLVNSGKEISLTIDLSESIVNLNEITIKANSNKDQPVNSMASISVRQLNIEEANRYAGGFDDPARLASTYAGVSGNLSNNGIVIRGNSPKGLLWRMEGIDISTPSHFANITTFGGGGITALSSQMLSNSDFYTGAFPAEYGNALSGVFDLKLRNGNNEKTEYTLQAGALGLDLAIEGPITKKHKASFLFNYRYSTFSLLEPFLPEDAGGIRYQDLCFKLNFPTQKAGIFSVWGIGALDKNPQFAEKDSMKWIYTQDMEEGTNDLGMGGLGLNHKLQIGSTSYMQSSFAISGNGLDHNQKRMDSNLILQPLDKIGYYTWKYTFSSFLNHKFSARHTNRTGFQINKLFYDIDIRETQTLGQQFETIVNDNASCYMVQYYSQSKINISPQFTLNAGLHGQYFEINKQNSIEPRASISYNINPRHRLTIGYGMHTQTEMIQIYLIKSNNNYLNKNLKFSQAQHFVMGYDWNINPNLHFKIEPYYQILHNIPVINNSSFSVINLEKDWFLNDSLINRGKGKNTGIDFTLEHYLDKGYYYLITASLLDSKYTGGDNMERNTRYNRNYVINVLGGKEWVIQKQNIFSINGRLNFLGGERISPLDTEASVLSRDAIYDETRSFTNSKPNVWYGDITINYKINRKKHSSTWSLKIINCLGTKEFYGYRYNHKTGMMEKEEEAIMLPNLSYKIEF